MEAALVKTPRDTLVRTLRALLEPLYEHWGDAAGFIRDAVPLIREYGGQAFDEKAARATAEQTYQQVIRLRALQFRPCQTREALEQVHERLQKGYATTPFRQGCLWLAHRLQDAVLRYLDSTEGQEALDTVHTAVGKRRHEVSELLHGVGNPTLDRIEAALASFIQDVLVDEAEGRFHAYALAGHLIERVRASLRFREDGEVGTTQPGVRSAEGPAFSVLTDPVYNAELNEARQRFGRLSDTERNQRFEAFRKAMGRILPRVSRLAPEGFERFARAVETEMSPYPAPLEWVRTFLKPLYNNAAQSTLFANCNTPKSVHQRFQKVAEERSTNLLVLELARAFAMAAFQDAHADRMREFLTNLDLPGEFGFPTSLEEVRRQRAK